MHFNSGPNGGFMPDSPAGKAVLVTFIGVIFLVLIVVAIVKA